MSTQVDHSVYPNPSATHVVLEVRFPSTTTEPTAAAAGLRAGLREHFPLVDQMAQPMVTVDVTQGLSKVEPVTVLRFQSRDRAQTVAVTDDAVSIETTEYLGFEWYCEFLRLPLGVLADVLTPDGIVSMGHRFIDEIRVPGDAPVDWSQWIDPHLLAPSMVPSEAGLESAGVWRASIEYRIDQETALTLRYGPSDGPIAIATPSKRKQEGPPGPCFLLDWDTRWHPRTAPEFTADNVIDQCRRLYSPVRAMYHHLPTDELRAVFATPPEGSP